MLHFGWIIGAPEYLTSSPGDDYRRRRTVDWHRPVIAAELNAAEILPSIPDKRLLEVAIHTHAALQNNLAAEAAQRGLSVRLPGPGGPPYDLAWFVESSRLTVCEVKSLTAENEVAQLRTGIGQALDYANRIRDVENVRRLLWVQHEPCGPDHWLQVCASANITLAWPGEEDRVLDSSEQLP